MSNRVRRSVSALRVPQALSVLSTTILAVGAALPVRGDIDPVVVGSWPGLSRPEKVPLGVALSGNRAYLAHGSGGLVIIDIRNPARPEQLGGFAAEQAFAQGIAVSGNLAFVAAGDAGLQIVDVLDPVRPRLVGSYVTSNQVMSVAVTGLQACVVDGTGLHVIDISNPSAPQRVGAYAIPESARAVAVSGNHAYVASQSLLVLDVSAPTQPRRVGEYPTEQGAIGVAVSGHLACLAYGDAGFEVLDVSNPAAPRRLGGDRSGGSARGIVVSGDRAFVSEWPRRNAAGDKYLGGGLEMIDLSDPTNPRHLGRYNGVRYSFGVAVLGGHAFLAHGGQQGWPGEWFGAAGLEVIDVSNPAIPERLGAYVTSGEAKAVAVSGHYAYLADGSAGLQVLDVSIPSSPRRVSRYATRGNAGGLAVAGKYAYLADGELQVIDISDPINPRRVGGCGAGAYGVALSGHYAYVADSGLHVVDISVPTDPRRVSGQNAQGAAFGVALSGRSAYLADYNVGLVEFDVSNPNDPRRIGAYEIHNGPTLGVTVSGRHAYVTTAGGMEVFDISHSPGAKHVGAYATLGYARGVTIDGHRAYVADDRGVHVVDVSDPVHPVRVGGNVSFNSPTYGVAFVGNLAFVAAGLAGLTVIDVSCQANPQHLGSYATIGHDLTGLPGGLAVAGRYAYVPGVGRWNGTRHVGSGVQVVDISQPDKPQGAGAYLDPGFTQGIAVSGNYAYVANGGAYDGSRLVGSGLQVIDVSDPAVPRLVGGYAIRGASRSLVLSGDHAFVTHDRTTDGEPTLEPGIEIINISIPADPQRIGGYDLRSSPSSVAVFGHYAYVADFGRHDGARFAGGGLEVIDISDPAHPRHAGGYYTVGQATAVAVSDEYAYLAEVGLVDAYRSVPDTMLHIIDLSQRTNPRRVGGLATGYASSAVVAGHHVYLAGGYGGVEVIDIQDPARPWRVSGNSSFLARDIVVSQGKVFLSAIDQGLTILEMHPSIRSISRSEQSISLSWEGFGPARLQRTSRLATTWDDVPGYERTNSATLPTRNGPEFFRLVRP